MIELLLGFAPVIVLLCYILWADRRQPEPFNELLFALLLGGVATIFSACFSIPAKLAGLFSTTQQTYLDAFNISFFGAGIPEELAKLILLYAVAHYNKFFDERLDGIVYAACIGLGFAGVENVMYLMNAGDHLAQSAITRALLSVPGHFCFAVFMGYWFSRWWWDTKDHGIGPERQIGYLFMALVIPVILHTIYDWICFSTDILNKHIEGAGGLLTLFLFFLCSVFHKKGRKRLLTHLTKDQQQRVTEKAEMHLGEYNPEETYKIYSIKQITIASWLASPFAGILMASHNCDVYQDLKGKNLVWMWGTLGTVAAMFIPALAPKSSIAVIISPLLLSALASYVMKRHQGLIPEANLQRMTFRNCIGRSLLGILFTLITATTIITPIIMSSLRSAEQKETEDTKTDTADCRISVPIAQTPMVIFQSALAIERCSC